MKPTKEEEKKLLGLFKKMESQKNRNDKKNSWGFSKKWKARKTETTWCFTQRL